jgi:hypothetical protein
MVQEQAPHFSEKGGSGALGQKGIGNNSSLNV